MNKPSPSPLGISAILHRQENLAAVPRRAFTLGEVICAGAIGALIGIIITSIIL